METKNGCGDARGGELFQFVAEILAIRAGHDDAFEYSFAVPAADVGEHIGVHVGIVVEFGFGEDGETDVAKGFHPGAHDVGTAGSDVGEHRCFRFDTSFQLFGQLL